MKQDATASLGAFLSKYDKAVQQVAKEAIAEIRTLIPGAVELVYDNYNALVIAFSTTERQADIICSVALYPKWVNLFFLHGSTLADPEGLLAKSGKTIKHVRLSDRTVIHANGVIDLIIQARGLAVGAQKLTSPGRVIIKSVSKKQRPRRSPAKQVKPPAKSQPASIAAKRRVKKRPKTSIRDSIGAPKRNRRTKK